MRYTLYVDGADREKLEFEVVSRELRTHLTRLAEKRIDDSESDSIFALNQLVNSSRSLVGLPVYVLEPDTWGDYRPEDYAWHRGEMKLAFLRPDTVQLVELLAELIDQDLFAVGELNGLLDREGLSFRFESEPKGVTVAVRSIEDLIDEGSEAESAGEHENVRVLVHRMERALKAEDVGGVLHASASVFETLAKDIVGISSVQDQTLASFFDRYRRDSLLPHQVLDYIFDLYRRRNTTPLAGHGSLEQPTITVEQATVTSEMTKAFVRAEYQMRLAAEASRAPAPPAPT